MLVGTKGVAGRATSGVVSVWGRGGRRASPRKGFQGEGQPPRVWWDSGDPARWKEQGSGCSRGRAREGCRPRGCGGFGTESSASWPPQCMGMLRTEGRQGGWRGAGAGRMWGPGVTLGAPRVLRSSWVSFSRDTTRWQCPRYGRGGGGAGGSVCSWPGRSMRGAGGHLVGDAVARARRVMAVVAEWGRAHRYPGAAALGMRFEM